MPVLIDKVICSTNVFFCDTYPWLLLLGFDFYCFLSKNVSFANETFASFERFVHNIVFRVPWHFDRFNVFCGTTCDYDALHNGWTAYLMNALHIHLLCHCATDEMGNLHHESRRGIHFSVPTIICSQPHSAPFIYSAARNWFQFIFDPPSYKRKIIVKLETTWNQCKAKHMRSIYNSNRKSTMIKQKGYTTE